MTCHVCSLKFDNLRAVSKRVLHVAMQGEQYAGDREVDAVNALERERERERGM